MDASPCSATYYNVLFMLDIHFTLSKGAVEQTYGQLGQPAGQTKKATQPGII